MKDKDLMKLLLQNGWEEVHIKGSHHKLRKGNDTEIIPIHGKDVPAGLLNSILKRTGLR
jgi:mRNA interferase HicA